MVMQLGRMLRFYTSCHSILGSIRNLLFFFLFPFLGILFLSTFAFAQTTITYNYDSGTNGIGRLSSVTDPTGSTTFSYDVRGNVTQTVKVIEGNSFTTQSTYDSLNRITALTYPDNEVVSYTYDPAGNLKTVTGQPTSGPATNYVTNITYNSFGQRATITMGAGNAATSTTYTYNSNTLRLDRIYTTGFGGAVLQDLNYCYDYVGNVTRIAGDAVCTNTTGEKFEYDHLDRLTKFKGPYGDFTSSPYAYNEIGNMMTNPRYGSQSASYTYPSSGSGSVRPHAVTTVQQGSTTYTYDYDANGNMFLGPNRSITYDMENRPISITQGSTTIMMAYDYKGDRVKKVTGSATTYYVGVLYEKKGTTTTKHIFAGATRVALKSSDGDLLYFHRNHLGSTHVVTNVNGTVVEQIQYYPFGASFSDTGSLSVNHKFTSQELDAETGVYFYGARYYDPTLARFLSADTGGVSLSNPQTLNRYSYVLNNPLKYIDPTGNDPVQVDAAGNIVSIAPCGCGIVVTSPRIGTQITATWDPVLGAQYVVNAWLMPDASQEQILIATQNVLRWVNSMRAEAWNSQIDPAVNSLYGNPSWLAIRCELICTYELKSPIRPTVDTPTEETFRLACAVLPFLCGDELWGGPPFDASGLFGLTSINQIEQLIQKGKAPRTIDGAHKGKVRGEQDHIHFTDGTAVNRDGTYKHGNRPLTNAERQFLDQVGFKTPKK